MEQTKELQINIMNLKNIPGVVDVQVSDTPDYIDAQINEDTLKFVLYGVSHFVEFFVPKQICQHEYITVNEQFVHQVTSLLHPNAENFQNLVSIRRFYVDLETRQFVPLDGAVPLDEYSEEQAALVARLEQVNNVTGCILKNIVDPEILDRVKDDKAVLVVCTTKNFDDNTLGFVLPESVYNDPNTFDSIAESLEQLFHSAIVG